ncbi:glycosyltransferase [Mycobacterium sp.]|uniref:glycosyltransferase n=1 Tax=Mycobacterium sp. TaxID=1785 RepID=UPI003C73812D
MGGNVHVVQYVSRVDGHFQRPKGSIPTRRQRVLPSLYEGFGLPAIEAQKCGCPVIASDAAAIPETLRESAYYFDPLSTAEISRSIERVLLDRDLQSRLITLGARGCKQVLVEGLGTASRSPYN